MRSAILILGVAIISYGAGFLCNIEARGQQTPMAQNHITTTQYRHFIKINMPKSYMGGIVIPCMTDDSTYAKLNNKQLLQIELPN